MGTETAPPTRMETGNPKQQKINPKANSIKKRTMKERQGNQDKVKTRIIKLK